MKNGSLIGGSFYDWVRLPRHSWTITPKMPSNLIGVVLQGSPMKVGLSHVAEHRQHQIAAIADLLRDGAPVEMIILFGSYARGD